MAHKVTGELHESITGQMFEIGRQLREPRGYPFDPHKLKRALQDIVEGKFDAETASHVIDCDADPFTPEGWKVEEHQKGGKFVWNASAITLFLADGQRNGKAVEGHLLRKELTSFPTLNANVLDYLLKNPTLIPEEWKRGYVFFWGTIYRYRDGDLYVRNLCWYGHGWCWGEDWLGNNWSGDCPAALCTT